MFFAAGVGAYSAAMFHLMTHAFFKALLFLGSGSVITALHHEQDMRKMGGVKEKAPQTFYPDVDRHALALSGIGVPFLLGNGIGFAGFYSKDIMLESAYGVHTTVGLIAFWLGIDRGLHDGLLLDPPDVPDLLRQVSRRPSHLGPCPRIARGHADPALRAGCRRRCCRARRLRLVRRPRLDGISGARRRSP